MRCGGAQLVLACTLVVAASGVAHAQRPPRGAARGYAGVSIGAFVTAATVSAPFTFPVYGESARVDTDASWPAGPTFEVDGGVRLWHDVGVAVTFTRGRRDGESDVSGSIPHPFFFNRPRTLEAGGPLLTRTETALHIGVMWSRRLTRRMTVAAFAGPSVMAVDEEMITGVVISETYPYTEVRLSRATTARRNQSAMGVHAGGDVVFALSRHLGVASGARYSQATVTLESAANQHADVDLGGVVVRGGVRWLF
jgi:hypothetical protein